MNIQDLRNYLESNDFNMRTKDHFFEKNISKYGGIGIRVFSVGSKVEGSIYIHVFDYEQPKTLEEAEGGFLVELFKGEINKEVIERVLSKIKFPKKLAN